MGWAVGFDSNWNRDIGYGVPAICDHPECATRIDRGLAYVCGSDAYGGEHGCGLFFCSVHRRFTKRGELCERCARRRQPFDAKPDLPVWTHHKLFDASWRPWRHENRVLVLQMIKQLRIPGLRGRSALS